MNKGKTIGHVTASEIMRGNVVSYSDILNFLTYYNLSVDQSILNGFRTKKFSTELIEKYEDTHWLVPVYPTSLIFMAFRNKCLELNFTDNILDNQNLVSFHQPNWYLVRKQPQNIELNKKELSEEKNDPKKLGQENILSASVCVYTIIALNYLSKQTMLGKGGLFFPKEGFVLTENNRELVLRPYNKSNGVVKVATGIMAT